MPMPLYLSCKLFHSSMGFCHVSCGPFSVIPQVQFHIMCLVVSVVSLQILILKLLLIWAILLECNLPFHKHNNQVNSQIFRRVIKVPIHDIMTPTVSKTFLSFQSVAIVVILVDLFVTVCEIQVT
jgi:hypothetical protein